MLNKSAIALICWRSLLFVYSLLITIIIITSIVTCKVTNSNFNLPWRVTVLRHEKHGKRFIRIQLDITGKSSASSFFALRNKLLFCFSKFLRGKRRKGSSKTKFSNNLGVQSPSPSPSKKKIKLTGVRTCTPEKFLATPVVKSFKLSL